MSRGFKLTAEKFASIKELANLKVPAKTITELTGFKESTIRNVKRCDTYQAYVMASQERTAQRRARKDDLRPEELLSVENVPTMPKPQQVSLISDADKKLLASIERFNEELAKLSATLDSKLEAIDDRLSDMSMQLQWIENELAKPRRRSLLGRLERE